MPPVEAVLAKAAAAMAPPVMRQMITEAPFAHPWGLPSPRTARPSISFAHPSLPDREGDLLAVWLAAPIWRTSPPAVR